MQARFMECTVVNSIMYFNIIKYISLNKLSFSIYNNKCNSIIQNSNKVQVHLTVSAFTWHNYSEY